MNMIGMGAVRPARAMLALMLAGLAAGCNVPPNMSVRTGDDPKYADDSVLFRTTYYFRVVDYCDYDGARGRRIAEKNYKRPLHTDSLYRYTMTGKASGLFSKVFFESGTLKAHEIAPFGRTVQIGADGSIKLVSIDAMDEKKPNPPEKGSETQEKPGQSAGGENTGTGQTNRQSDTTASTTKVSTTKKVTITEKTAATSTSPAQEKVTVTETTESSDKPATTSADSPATDKCWVGEGVQTKRGFQIHGPAGWEDFKQDERLMLVMSSNARPLIDALKAASERISMQKAKASNPLPALAIEASKARKALASIEAATSDTDPKAAIDAAINSLTETAP